MLSPSPDADGASGTPRRSHLVLAATLLVQTFVTFAGLSLAAVAPSVAAGLDISPNLIGYQFSLIYGSAVISSLAAGTVIPRLGACRTSQVAMGCIAAGGFLCGQDSLAAIAAGSIVIGIAQGLVNPAASQLLMRYAPTRNRTLIFAIKQTGQPLGAFLAGMVCPPIALYVDWRLAPVVPGAGALILGLLLHPACHRWDGPRRDAGQAAAPGSGALEGLKLISRRADLRLLTGASFCFAFLQLSLMAFLVTLLVEDHGIGLVAAGGMLAMTQISGVAGRVAWGWISDRSGDGLLMLALQGLIMSAAALMLTVLGPDTPRALLYVAIVLLGASAMSWTAVFMAEVARLAPPQAVGAATGASLAVTFFAILIGPAIFATIQPLLGGYEPTIQVFSVVALVGTVSAIGARRAARP